MGPDGEFDSRSLYPGVGYAVVGNVVDGDPVEEEGRPLDEQDAIEYELGLEDFRGRN